MSPAMDNEKLKQLAFACTALAARHIYGHTCGDSVIEHATALARELFPPMAKALVWDKAMGEQRVIDCSLAQQIAECGAANPGQRCLTTAVAK